MMVMTADTADIPRHFIRDEGPPRNNDPMNNDPTT
jgi:hypothetical protein